jgi:hypothetical protein
VTPIPRRIIICAAFATFCFLNTWVELAQGNVAYSARWDPLQVTVPAVLTLQALLTALLFLAWTTLRNRGLAGAAWLHSACLLLCLLPAGVTSLAVLRMLPWDTTPLIRHPWFWPAALALLLPVLAFSLWRPKRMSAAAAGLLLYSLPVLLVLAIADVRAILNWSSPNGFRDLPLLPRQPAKPQMPRIVWVIFDELSQNLVFDHRPAAVHLPHFDRLRAHSFYARAAQSPADSTDRSLPALFLGEPVLASRPAGAGTLLLKTAAHPGEFSWTSVPNVLSDARQLGVNTALAGWYHPYGRLWNPHLTASAWTAGWLLSGVEEPTEPLPLPAAMLFRLRMQLAAFPLLGHWPGYFPGALHQEEKKRRLEYLLQNARHFIADKELGLVVLHLPVPHPPAIVPRGNYLDSLVTADQTLGEILDHLPPQTTLIVSSDHGWRTALWRGGPDWTSAEDIAAQGLDLSAVPFLVSFPGDEKAIESGEPFDTVRTRSLIRAIFQGRVRSAAQLAEWQNEGDHAHQAAAQAR